MPPKAPNNGWLGLADLPLAASLHEALEPYEHDEVTRLIVDHHDAQAFAAVGSLTVGEFRDRLLSEPATPRRWPRSHAGLTPEMAAAVSKLMRNQGLVLAARECRVVTRFRETIGLPGRRSVRLQPNLRHERRAADGEAGRWTSARWRGVP